MEKEGSLKNAQFTSMDDCIAKIGHGIRYGVGFMMFFMGILNVHFALVLYSHWKNAKTLPRSEGGLSDQPGAVELHDETA